MFPNPVTNRFTVDIRKQGNCTIQIVDVKGTLVFSRKYTRDANPLQIESNGLAAGQYVLKIVIKSGERETLKFIKM